jgi:ubiquinone/menaquinone biosynthesis C-methylase UbiE
LVLTDVTLLGDADIAADGHCLPFKTGVFDLVIADQVIEHVLKPNQVVEEMNRVLRVGGCVFSGIPFYFHCHGFPYDFQRYTPLGHRLLYPQCETVSLSLPADRWER